MKGTEKNLRLKVRNCGKWGACFWMQTYTPGREDRRRLGGEVREERMAGGLLVVDADRQAGKPEEGGDLLCCWRIEGFI